MPNHTTNSMGVWRHGLLVLMLIACPATTCAFMTTSHVHPVAIRTGQAKTFPLLVSNKETEPPVNGDVNGDANSVNGEQNRPTRQHRFTYLPRLAIRIYSEYASRLWRETNSDARRRIASDKVTRSVKNVQHVFRGEEYCDLSNVSNQSRQNLLDACDSILSENDGGGEGEEAVVPVAAPSSPDPASDKSPATKKKGRSKMFGAAMGAAVACWVFSGNYIFAGLFTLMTILGQLEYYRMVMNTGTYKDTKTIGEKHCTCNNHG